MKRSGPLRRTARLRARPRPGWATVRRLVLQRDHGRCRVCDALASDVHHIAKRSTFGKKCREAGDSADGLITLCRACHRRTDAAYADGRLVIRALGNGRFAHETIWALNKFSARSENFPQWYDQVLPRGQTKNSKSGA